MSKSDTYASKDMKGQVERVPKVSGDTKKKTSVAPRKKTTTVRFHILSAFHITVVICCIAVPNLFAAYCHIL